MHERAERGDEAIRRGGKRRGTLRRPASGGSRLKRFDAARARQLPAAPGCRSLPPVALLRLLLLLSRLLSRLSALPRLFLSYRRLHELLLLPLLPLLVIITTAVTAQSYMHRRRNPDSFNAAITSISAAPRQIFFLVFFFHVSHSFILFSPLTDRRLLFQRERDCFYKIDCMFFFPVLEQIGNS